MTVTTTKAKQATRKKQTERKEESSKKDLIALAKKIRDSHRACLESVRTSIDHAIRTGLLLIEARKSVPHGDWLPWLKRRCGLQPRVVRNDMRIAKHQGQVRRRLAKSRT